MITGIHRGLGRSLAKKFYTDGHFVAGCSRSPASFFEGTVWHQQLDVTDGEAVSAWAAQIFGRWSRVDLLVNNAGLINSNAPLWQVPEKEFERVMAVNLGGIHKVLRAFLPRMIEARAGLVVNFSSTWGRSTSPEVAPYCASKWGVEGLTRALAQELPPGMAAVSLNPGIIHTDMLESCFGEAAAHYPGPDRWAEKAAEFLLSLEASDNGKALAIG